MALTSVGKGKCIEWKDSTETIPCREVSDSAGTGHNSRLSLTDWDLSAPTVAGL